jgi:trehalose 2-sulfotransferase
VSEPARRSFFICATPRSGSSLLCEALEFTRIAGRPREFFEPKYEPDWFARLGIASDAEYVRKFQAAGATPNGVFGAKLHWHQFLHLQTRLLKLDGTGANGLELVRDTFPDLKFLFLTRRDKVRQAVSYDKALRFDCWHSLGRVSPGDPESSATSAPMDFNFDQIDRWVRQFTTDETNWCRYFEAVGIEPFDVVYEDFVENYEETVRNILRFLEISIPEGMIVTPPRLRKLADEVSEDWACRYRAMKWPARPIRSAATQAYFICTSPRTGGFLLAEGLESTQVAGRPREYFDPEFQKQWCEAQAFSTDTEYYGRVLTAGSTPNGVFGAKVLWHQFGPLLAKLRKIEAAGLADLEMLRRAFPDLQCVFLTRTDKLRQAISYDRAIRSGVWWSIRGEIAENPDESQPEFQFETIDEWVTRLGEFESNWRRQFRKMGIAPFEVAYEDLISEFETTIVSILSYLNLREVATGEIAPPRLRKQADKITEEWVRCYQELKS